MSGLKRALFLLFLVAILKVFGLQRENFPPNEFGVRLLLVSRFFSLGLTQLMSFCVGADDSLPENILCKGLKPPLQVA